MTEDGPRVCDLLIRNGYLLTMDDRRTVYARGALAIDGPVVAAVGPEREIAPRFRPRRVLDARGAPVHPGFVDGHVHLSIHTTRGVFPDVARFGGTAGTYTDWFNALEPEDEHAAGLLACLELLRSGTTCFMEPGTLFDPDAGAAAATAVGIRASVADPFLWDDAGTLALARDLRRAPANRGRALQLLGGELRRNADPDALVRGHVAIYGGVSASDELESAASACAREAGVALTQHQSARVPEMEADDARFGRHPLVHFADRGILGPHCAFVHMNMLRPDELEPVLQSGMSIVWCAANSMNWGNGAGIPTRRHIPDLFHRGLNVALGSDMGKFGMDAQTLAAYLLGRDREGEPLEAEDVLVMATRGGARAMQLDRHIGSLEPGKRADIVIRSNDLPEAHPGASVAQAIALSGRAKAVDTVLVDGQIVLKHGRATRVDEGAIYELARRSTEGVMARAGLRVETRWPVVA